MSDTSMAGFLLFSSASSDLGNMGARASMSMVSTASVPVGDHSLAFRQSITAFGQLWGLVACHSYGHHGMRVCFPIRQLLCVVSQSISKNIERLSYAQRLHTRKLARENSPVSHGEPLTLCCIDQHHALGSAPLWIYHIECGRSARTVRR